MYRDVEVYVNNSSDESNQTGRHHIWEKLGQIDCLQKLGPAEVQKHLEERVYVVLKSQFTMTLVQCYNNEPTYSFRSKSDLIFIMISYFQNNLKWTGMDWSVNQYKTVLSVINGYIKRVQIINLICFDWNFNDSGFLCPYFQGLFPPLDSKQSNQVFNLQLLLQQVGNFNDLNAVSGVFSIVYVFVNAVCHTIGWLVVNGQLNDR